MKTNNTISAFHIRSIDENYVVQLNTDKLYKWNIPKRLREDPIQKGDIVVVETFYGKANVLVIDTFREEFEETQQEYRKVVKMKERVPQKK